MRSPPRVTLSTLALYLGACAAGQRSPPVPPSPPAPAPLDAELAEASLDASDAAPEADAARAQSEPSVRPRSVLRAASADARWRSVGQLSPVGSRGALEARLQQAARRALAAVSAEERRELLEEHRERLRWRGRRPRSLARPTAARSAEGGSLGHGAPEVRAAPPANSAPSHGETITNNQVSDVDEGDIVKASGDNLLILRRGNLFRVSVANGGMRLVGHAPAYPPHTRPGDWYDELLLDGDIALVLGYDYRSHATEVNRFRLEASGALRYLDSFYLRSADYYSSENYATRLAGGRFLLYVPADFQLDDLYAPRLSLPTVRVGRTGAFREVYDYARVFASSAAERATTLHTVLSCDIHGPSVRCSAQGVLGGSSRSYYVSGTAVYVWSEGVPSGGEDNEQAPGSWVVRMPLRAQEAPGAARIHGGPVDQFAFDERGGALHLLLRADGQGDRMWSSFAPQGAVAALRVPLEALRGGASDAPAEAYTALTALGPGAFRERWIGEYALFGTGRSPYGSRSAESNHELFAYRATDAALFELQPGHGVERLEPLGAHALAVGNRGATLALTPIALDGPAPRTLAPLQLPGQAQGETRSHAFFFHPSGPTEGLFGIATSRSSAPGYHQLHGASDVSFFRVAQLSLSRLGALESRALAQGRCAVSCADWYGNTRPLFWHDRVFALLGDELAEATFTADSLTERARLDYGSDVATVVSADDEE